MNFWNTVYTEPCVTLTYSQPIYIQALAYWEPEENCGPFSTEPCITLAYSELSHIQNHIKYLLLCSDSCVTRTYLKPWYIHNPRHIHNTVKRLLWNILFKSLCNLVIFRTLVYSQLWYILKSKKIQSTTAYLRSSILLKSLCNYSKSRRPIYSKLSLIQNSSVSATP